MVDVICIDSCASDSDSWWKSFSINNTYLKCKLDSGAQANAMSMSAFNMLKTSGLLRRANATLSAYNIVESNGLSTN
jgi:hypothetical protein